MWLSLEPFFDAEYNAGVFSRFASIFAGGIGSRVTRPDRTRGKKKLLTRLDPTWPARLKHFLTRSDSTRDNVETFWPELTREKPWMFFLYLGCLRTRPPLVGENLGRKTHYTMNSIETVERHNSEANPTHEKSSKNYVRSTFLYPCFCFYPVFFMVMMIVGFNIVFAFCFNPTSVGKKSRTPYEQLSSSCMCWPGNVLGNLKGGL